MRVEEQVRALETFPRSFWEREAATGSLGALTLKTFQINVGKVCNQACRHCHVDASPARTESMTREVMDLCLEAIAALPEVEAVDITGGAPELNPHFRYLVDRARALGKRVIDRCNLTVLAVPGQEDLAEFLASREVEVTASLPHFSAGPTDRQRGAGVYEKSIAALKKLNGLGYGRRLPLNLVYNPAGLFLSSTQGQLEREFKEKLASDHGIVFHSLYCLNNMPINRFLESLLRKGMFEEYMDALSAAYNPATLEGLMCRHQISVGYDGSVYDCDFNQMLEIKSSPIGHIRDFRAEAFLSRNIRVHNHCYGCTAGAGSSCGGAIA